MHVTFRPSSPRYLAGCLVLVACLTYLLTVSAFSSLIFSWARTSEIIRDSTLVSGPLLTILSAYSGALHRTIAIGTVPQRSQGQILIFRLLPLIGAGVLGWLVGVTPVIVLTASHATWGHVDGGVIATTAALWVVWACSGYMIGRVVSFPFSILVALGWGLGWVYLPEAVTAFAAGLIPDGFSFLSIAPVWFGFHPGVGWIRPNTTTLFTLLFYAILVGCCVWIAGRRQRLMALVVPAVMSLAIVSLQPTLIESDQAEPVCRIVEGVTVCVHPAQKAAFVPIGEAYEWAEEVLPIEAFPDLMSDEAAQSSTVAGLELDSEASKTQIASDTYQRIGQWSSALWSCTTLADPANGGTGSLSDRQEAVQTTQFILFNRAFGGRHGVPLMEDSFVTQNEDLAAFMERFRQQVNTWTPSMAGTFISEHQKQLQTCDTSVLAEIG